MPYKWNDYGFELDGANQDSALYNGKDKFFFMVDDEWKKIRTIGQGSATVPSAAKRAAIFRATLTAAGAPVTIYDPATGDANGLGKTPFPNNTIPFKQNYRAVHGVAEIPGDKHYVTVRNGGVVSNYVYPTSSPQNRQSLTVRGDYYLSEKSQFAFRYSSGNENIISTGLLGAGSKTHYQLSTSTWDPTPGPLRPTL